jgi:hypothetical protein
MRKGWEHLLAIVDRFHRAGGTVLAGTDCPNVGIVSGFSPHGELEVLVRAGLSPMDALLAATSRPAAPPTSCCSAPIRSPTSVTCASSGSSRAAASTTRHPPASRRQRLPIAGRALTARPFRG